MTTTGRLAFESPQQESGPSTAREQVRSLEADRLFVGRSEGSRAGAAAQPTLRPLVLLVGIQQLSGAPVPSCAFALLPQHEMAPSLASAQVCQAPTVTADQVVDPGGGSGAAAGCRATASPH